MVQGFSLSSSECSCTSLDKSCEESGSPPKLTSPGKRTGGSHDLEGICINLSSVSAVTIPGLGLLLRYQSFVVLLDK